MKIGFIAVLAMLAVCAYADRLSFDKNWKFIQEDVAGAEAIAYVDDAWRSLSVPHDWSIEGEYDASNPMADACGYLPAGIGWYRKTIEVPAEWKGRHVEIAFDGVCMNSTVWANGKKLGHRPYGWISFAYDISEIVDESDTITFAVRVDNDKQPSARWYTGSGIYAHTWIDVKDKVHVARDGVYIRSEGDKVFVDAEIRNTTGEQRKLAIDVSILDPEGKEVVRERRKARVSANEVSVVDFDFQVSNPLRWDTHSPHLYKAIVEVVSGQKKLDTVTTRFGIRDIEWKVDTGFWLNGRNVKLRGVCNHQDAGPLGAAVPDKIVKFRIEQLKAMGVNSIRTAHNPMTPEFYDYCDELGILVMDEIFDGWHQKAEHDYGAHAFDEWWERDLTDWMRRDRNHPSIVIWSVGNETKGEDSAKALVKLCHELDPTRPVTSGHSAHEVMDVYGANGASEQNGFFENLVTHQPFIGTENTHTFQVRGYYRSKTWYRNGYPSTRHNPHYYPDYTEEEIFTYDWIDEADRAHPKHIFFSSYDNSMVRLTSGHNIEKLRDIPNFSGTYRWCGHDYLGEAKYHGGWPFKAFSGGAIDLSNFEKDLYYLYQSQWTEAPMVHILPHWTHPSMKTGTKVPVQVYSTCEEVELFFNGRSLGKQKPGITWDKMACQWMVGWEPGEIKAVGYNQGRAVANEVVRTAGAPAQLDLSIDGEPLSPEGEDIVQVRVSTQDKQGEFYPYGENRSWFHVIGPARIRALGNGSPVDTEKHQGVDNRIAFYGLTRAFVQATGEEGNIALLTSSILGEKKLVYSQQVSIDTKLLTLRGNAPEAKIKVFYTLDGSEPSKQSTRYNGSFEVVPGTTVKALVVLNGEAVQTLEERFAMDEGFVWKSSVAAADVLAGEQAERATFEGAKVVGKGKGQIFRGDGYIQFVDDPNQSVEWYYENDGDSGRAKLAIRYGGIVEGEKGHRVRVIINGEVVEESLLLSNSDHPGRKWSMVKVPMQIERGANRIRLEPLSGEGLCLDEIVIR
ncbi:glycoside hydrolase family 2 TIM barrel-domain containing protein [Pelagicoccus mobilis]|uniref:DUF4982 domain-containing protein n=1 Tax=Pelagicoccus mobilis TaxID=415221 RepID=A0A934VRM5_9BACT|nr:glycoside hydrolase family 2 TIM barrel-domain containing protein [Pelagicoccus mobilis]MBK1877639.1 DUF4982 domain-containing protein [Pelagicoccus mobilis]